MNEETTFLEEMEETLEETASAKLKEPRTPLEDFAFWLRDLGGCASFRGNFVSLDRAKAGVMAADADEAYQSKAKCRDAAKKRVDKAIHEARQKMECRMSVSGSSSFYREFRQRFDHRLDALREKLELLRTPENIAIVDEMEGYLTASEIHKNARKICGDPSGQYSLQPASAYYGEISYDAWDLSDFEEGLSKLFAKGFIRHGFSCYEVIQAIEKDAQVALDSFQADFNTQMQDEILSSIVEPVQKLIPKLRDAGVLRSA
jgi:hypothetical protein